MIEGRRDVARGDLLGAAGLGRGRGCGVLCFLPSPGAVGCRQER